MRNLMFRLWRDDRGSTLVTGEILFLFTILVIGVVSGLVALRQAMLSELIETAQALLALDQSFSFSGQSNCQSSTAGSSASDAPNTIREFSAGAGGAALSQSPCDQSHYEPGVGGGPPGAIADRPPAPGGAGGASGGTTGRPPVAGLPRALGGAPAGPGPGGGASGGAGFVGGGGFLGNGPPRGIIVSDPVPGDPRSPGGAGMSGGGASGNGGSAGGAGSSQNPTSGGGNTAPQQPGDGGGGGGQPPEKQPAADPPKKSAVLICVDGTGPNSTSEYEKEMANSFVHRIYLDSPITLKRYHRGPNFAGYGAISPEEVRKEVKELLGQAKGQKAGPVFMTGYSRGAANVITAAKLLKKDGIEVEALFLFDSVTRDSPPWTLDADVISNVKKCYHAVRDPRAESRTTFGNSGMKREGSQELDDLRYFMTTHGGMGGVPWGPEAVGDNGLIYENGDSWIGKLGKTNVTPAQDVKGSKQVHDWMWKYLRENGVLR
jgi:hypothetical protein